MVDPPRTRSQAKALVARNQEQSPLLRLPGELRNKIYQHLFEDFIIEVVKVDVENQPSRIRTHLAVCKANSRDAKVAGPIMSRDTFQECFESILERASITLASRQLYAETRLLLLQVSSLRLRGTLCSHSSDMYGYIPPAQLATISSVRFDTAPIFRDRYYTQRVHIPSTPNLPTLAVHAGEPGPTTPKPPSPRFSLKRLPSLRTVIVEGYSPTADKVRLEEYIRDLAGKQDLKIVYE